MNSNLDFKSLTYPPSPRLALSKWQEPLNRTLKLIEQGRKGWLAGLALLILGLMAIILTVILPGQLARERQVYFFEEPVAPNLVSNPPTAPDNHNLRRSPSIQPAAIEAVLKQYHSPASATAEAFYKLGMRYGIDPAYALAFFIHESSAGTQGVARFTKAIGNIRCSSGYDCYQTEGNGAFRRYSSWEAGIEDWYKLIHDLYIGQWGLQTLEQIIPVYAPSADHNNPTTYIEQVARLVESWR